MNPISGQPAPVDQPINSAEMEAINKQKAKLRQVLQGYLKNRSVEIGGQQQATKKVLGVVNATQQQTSDKKASLAIAALNKLNGDSIQTTEHLRILASAIIAEDISIEQAKDKINKQKHGVSVAESSDPSWYKVPTSGQYEERLQNYLDEPTLLTLDLTTHPHTWASGLFKAVRPLLDGEDVALAPEAVKCADILKAFREKFKIVHKKDSQSSLNDIITTKFTNAQLKIDKYRDSFVKEAYKLLLQADKQTYQLFDRILFNLFALERQLVRKFTPDSNNPESSNFAYFSCFNIPADGDDFTITFTENFGDVSENIVFTVEALLISPTDQQDIKTIAMPSTYKSVLFFKTGVTEIETFVRDALEDLSKALKLQQQHVARKQI